MPIEKHRALLSMRPVLRVIIFFTTNLIARAHSVPSFPAIETPTFISSYYPVDSQPLTPPSFSSSAEALLADSYHPITPRHRFRWFVTSTIGPSHLAGTAFTSGCGTAVNRPEEYGSHWRGYANRFLSGTAGSATANAMEAGAGFFFREDPRYLRVAQLPFKTRVGNVVRLTFSTRSEDARLIPAYARFLGIIGGNFLSNTWRVPSEANWRDALLRSSEAFAGRMAANAFREFWPDLKRYVFNQPRQGAVIRFQNAN